MNRLLPLLLTVALLAGCDGGADTPDALALVKQGKADSAGMVLTFDYPYSRPAKLFFTCESAAGCDVQVSACATPRKMNDLPWLVEQFQDQEAPSTVLFRLDPPAGAGQAIEVEASAGTHQSCGHLFRQGMDPGRYDLIVSLKENASSFIKELFGESVDVEVSVTWKDLDAGAPQAEVTYQPVLLTAHLSNQLTTSILSTLGPGSTFAGAALPVGDNAYAGFAPAWDVRTLGRFETAALLNNQVDIRLSDVEGEPLGSCAGLVTAEHLAARQILLGPGACTGAVTGVSVDLWRAELAE